MRRCFLIAVLFLVQASGCRDGNTVKPQPPDRTSLTGTWDLRAWTYRRDDDTTQSVDWVSLRGLTGTLTVAANGDFQVTPALASGGGSDHGALTQSADSLYWDGENDEEWVHFGIYGRMLVLDWPETEVVDMDRDGQPEHAWLRATFEKR